MITQELLDSLSSSDKNALLGGLKELIEQSYKVEQEFIELKGLFEGVLELLPNALWVLDEEGGLVYQNSESFKISYLLEHILAQPSGGEFEFDSCHYLVQINQKMGKKIISVTDITDEKRKERLISMGQVAAHLAHEIRNPIGSVTLLSSTLLKRVDMASKPLVLEIKKATWRVERIIKATLLFSRGVQISRTLFELERLKDEVELAMSYYPYSTNIHLDVRFPAGARIEADFDLLGIVVQNFIFNAIDAIEELEDKEEGNIELSYHEDGGWGIFEIYDDGKPIENKNILFEPFKTTKIKGNGLGLALSLRIIEAHEGRVTLIEGERKGFRIMIKKIS
ncbi:MAG: sensor histidine kinase [Wolinella sp.]